MSSFPPEITPVHRPAYIRYAMTFGRVAVAIAFVAAVYVSGRLGVEMARNRIPESKAPVTAIDTSTTISVGNTRDPVYLARTPESLRSFFAANPTTEGRSRADLSGLGIRRLQDAMEVKVLRSEADAIEVVASSGAIAGAIYWIHYSQLPNPSDFDPIISPLPVESTR
ncbi:MAG: hypothetical protein ABL994_24395 [Verrucomicrobiales bacterium]